MADVIKPGDKALFSGIYQAIHGKNHAEPHLVTMLYGEVFPVCLICADKVQFELAMSAVYVKAHRHFKRD
jgi:hypothetical protein